MDLPDTPLISSSTANRKGNWITFRFVIGASTCLTIAAAGWVLNLIVFLISEFNVDSIDAAQVYNVVNGAYNLFPIVGAIIADSFLGSFSVVAVSSCVSLLGILFLALTATLDSLRPTSHILQESSLFRTPLVLQYTLLYGGLALGSVGLGGSRFTIATLGANQFDQKEDRDSFFNWYFFSLNFSSLISATAIIYIEDNVSWCLGFWICVGFNFVGIVLLLLGYHFYRHDKPHGSPYVSIAQVVIAAIRKRKVWLSPNSEDYYFERALNGNEVSASISTSFRFFNRAALKAEGETKPDGSIGKPWKLCSVQRVEDLKTLIRIFPVWSTAIFLCVPMTILMSLSVLQALTMDRQFGRLFEFPAGSISVIPLLSISLFLTINDRFLFRLCERVAGKSPTLFQRIGIGHILTILSMVVSALVESKRLKLAHAQDKDNSSTVPMLVVWIFPQLILIGIAEAFHFPGQVAFYYQEFPGSMRTTATAMISLILGISYYFGAALTDLIRSVTNWLPANIDDGRLNDVYWLLAIVGVLNFCYYLCCVKFYKYQDVEKAMNETSSVANVS